MRNSIFHKKLQFSLSFLRKQRLSAGVGTLLRSGLLSLLALSQLMPAAQLQAGFPYKRIDGKSRIEGPIVPAPKNWGYRPTRWIRWETDIIHPALGPIAADAQPQREASEDGNTTRVGTSPSEEKNSSTQAKPDQSPLPPLPPDSGPPSLPPNLDEDLPPLPGDDFDSSKARAAQPQSPQPTSPAPSSKGPSSKPTFRDPDAIFDKPKTPAKSGDASGSLPPQAKDGTEKSTPATTPRPEKTTPSLPNATPHGQPPAPQQPNDQSEKTQWEKRTREKPKSPEEIKKQAPQKKPGEPFYDPESIFNERTTRATKQETNRWQRAGTARSPQRTGPPPARVPTAPNSSMGDIFSPVKRAERTAHHPVRSQLPERAPGNASVEKMPPRLLDVEPALPIPKQNTKQNTTWKSAKKQVSEVQPRVDRAIRPVSFEEPVSVASTSKMAPDKPNAIGSPSANVRQSTRGTATPTGGRNLATTKVPIARDHRSSLSAKKTKKVAPSPSTPSEIVHPMRNPMRDPLSQEDIDGLSENNPLRDEEVGVVTRNATDTQSKRANPLR